MGSTSFRDVKKPTNLLPRDISESLGKLPPQAVDLEETILGAAILERSGQIIALEKMVPDDFYKDANREVFIAMLALAEKGDPIDMRTVVQKLKVTGKLELLDGHGPLYIAQLTAAISSAANIEYYCSVVKEKRILRDIIRLASDLQHEAYKDEADAFKLVDMISKLPYAIYDDLKVGKEKHIGDRVKELAVEINKRTNDKPEIRGIPSGYTSLDNVTRGWNAPDLIVLAGRPGMGKTTFSLNCLRNAAIDFNVPAAIFSLEMSYSQVTDKIISSETDIGLRTLLDKVFEPVDWQRFNSKTDRLLKSKIYIDDTPAISITDFRISARRLVEKYGVKFIIIDYLQLMRGPLGEKNNREQEIAKISAGLKAVCKELNIPIIALSQLSRSVETRGGDKRPQLSDLRESGAIEQDADIIGFLWRPEYYNITGDEGGSYIPGLTKIIIAKHRNGPIAEPCVAMIGKTSKFTSVDSPYLQNQKVETQPKWMDVQKQQAAVPGDDDMPF